MFGTGLLSIVRRIRMVAAVL